MLLAIGISFGMVRGSMAQPIAIRFRNSMKTAYTLATAAGVLLLLSPAFGQGSAFNYQGRMNQNGNPINGTIAMRFSVWDSAMAGNLLAGPLTNLTVSASQGLFAVTLDFGGSLFTG